MMHTFLLSGCIVPFAFQKRKWNIAAQQRTVVAFPIQLCAQHDATCSVRRRKEIRMHISEEANEKRTLRASAPLFPPRAECSTIKSKKGGCGALAFFLRWLKWLQNASQEPGSVQLPAATQPRARNNALFIPRRGH